MRKKKQEHEKENSERWLLTYSDMITLLLALFVVLYAISTVDAQKYQAISQGLGKAFGYGIQEGGPGGDGGGYPEMPTGGEEGDSNGNMNLSFSELYRQLIENINQNGYQDSISVIQDGSYIVVRFKDSVLFHPDQAAFLPGGYEVLENISGVISGLEYCIGHIQIEGHTARMYEDIDLEANATRFSWELSCNRSLAVLQYFSDNSVIAQAKMSVAGFSNFKPVADNSTEAGRALNRRIEIRLTQGV